MANPILAYFRYIVKDRLNGEPIRLYTDIDVPSDIEIPSFEALETMFIEDKVVNPMTLKFTLIAYINRYLEPVRQHFVTDPTARELRQKVLQYLNQ